MQKFIFEPHRAKLISKRGWKKFLVMADIDMLDVKRLASDVYKVCM